MAHPYRNRCEFNGSLIKDPEVVPLDNGVCATIVIAQTEQIPNRESGEITERAEFLQIKVYGPKAKFVAEYLSKGAFINVVCSFRTRSYEDNIGDKQYVHELVVNKRCHEINVLMWPKAKPEDETPGKSKGNAKSESSQQGTNQGTQTQKQKPAAKSPQAPKPTPTPAPAQKSTTQRKTGGIDPSKYPAPDWVGDTEEPFTI